MSSSASTSLLFANNSGSSKFPAKAAPSRPTYKIEGLSQHDARYALPIRVAQSCGTIEGRQTHVVSQHFADRILVIITQVGKMGALTQLTTHKRPTLPKIYDDEFLESSTTNKDEEEEMAKIGLDSNDATTTQALFGTAPPGQETLYDFYKQQISALVQSQAAMADSAFESKPVIVGLSLALPSTQQDMQDDDGDFAEVADSERHRFEAILNLVRQASVW